MRPIYKIILLVLGFLIIGGAAVTAFYPPVRESVGSVIGLNRAFGQSWSLDYSLSGLYPGPDGYAEFKVSNQTLPFKMPEKEKVVMKSDSVEWSADMLAITVPEQESFTMKGKVRVEGKIENDKFVFLPYYTNSICTGVYSGIFSGTQNCTSSTEVAGSEWVTIDLKDGAQVVQNSGAGGTTWTSTWTLKKSCQEKMPELKSVLEEVLSSAIANNETPEKTHEKMTALANQHFPVGRTFKDNNSCVKVIGFSVDLMYKKNGQENTIFKTTGSTNGSSHRIIDATVDQMSSAAQTYYRGTIDVSLNAE